MKLFRVLLPILVIGCGFAVAYYIYSNKPAPQRKPASKPEITVETITLQPQPFQVVIDAQGSVEPRTTTTLIPRVSGEIVQVSPHFRPGGFFEKGDTLLTIDQRDYQLEIKTAQAALAEAQFTFEQERAQAQQAADNWVKLGRTETPSDLVLHKPQLARAKAAVDAAQAKLQRIQLDLERTRIKAPYAGRIMEQFVDVGQYVSPGNPLAKIFAIDYVEIRLPITEKQRSMLNLPRSYASESNTKQRAPEAIIHALVAGKTYQWRGKVVRTEGAVDKTTRQIFVVVQVDQPYKRQHDNRPPLEIGQFVTASIKGKVLDEVLVLPRSAVQGNDTVLVVDQDDRLQRKTIAALWETRDAVIVKDGLQAGEQLSLTYIPLVGNQAKVKRVTGAQKK